MTGGLHAWTDESIHASRSTQGFYVLAATIAHPVDAESIRTMLRSLLASRSPRLHWSKESTRHREQIAKAVAALHLTHLIDAAVFDAEGRHAVRITQEALVRTNRTAPPSVASPARNEQGG